VEALIALGVILVFILFVLVRSVRIVPQATASVVERLGRYNRTLTPGLALLVPFVDRVRARIDLREQVVSFPPQPVITADNLNVGMDTVVYFQVTDPKDATYGIANYIQAMEQLTVTTLRNVVGGLNLEETLTSRDAINSQLRSVLDGTTGSWGIRVARVEIKAIDPPGTILESMEKQMKADRDKRAMILNAVLSKPGVFEADQLLYEAQDEHATVMEESERLRAESRAEAERLLVAAHAEADPLVPQAREEAERLLAEAHAEADPLVPAAREEAERLRSESRAEADRVLTESLAEAERVLAEAHNEAEPLVPEAREEAERLRSESRAEADRLLSEARSKVERTTSEAKRQAGELLASTRAQLTEQEEQSRQGAERVRTAIEELRRFRAEYRERVREVVAEQLSALDRVGEFPELPSALDGLEQQVAEPAQPEERENGWNEGGSSAWPGTGGIRRYPRTSDERLDTAPVGVRGREGREGRGDNRHENGS